MVYIPIFIEVYVETYYEKHCALVVLCCVLK